MRRIYVALTVVILLAISLSPTVSVACQPPIPSRDACVLSQASAPIETPGSPGAPALLAAFLDSFRIQAMIWLTGSPGSSIPAGTPDRSAPARSLSVVQPATATPPITGDGESNTRTQ